MPHKKREIVSFDSISLFSMTLISSVSS